jgi:hypothetical protein
MEVEPYEYWQNDQLEEAFRPPMLVTLVFVIVMLAIYFMSQTTQSLYPSLGDTPEPIALVVE